MKEDDRSGRVLGKPGVRARRPRRGWKGDELAAVGPTRPESEISESPRERGGGERGGSFSHIDHTTLAPLYQAAPRWNT